ncbi:MULTISPECIES: hypothetical protein [unclassified Mycolicibacterium]|uniref:hypothetical protein n=1 Tax=unclassified Mycolicibacterium TaxID=2636767 RepID=UPI0012DC4280|nr:MULTISPECIES: hypothetical protein [unclassified Mycolicibacterium]MUL83715.1 hypothetical protein [Mycolicibacterium sp. CBMA 329]MUL90706.1 hypothetical protein [Mycolicibacterium sp. CBMA 331]MUM00675.1 hypothetical protein [Mycolicibacterium sp. CBMA 334]MUM41650.1 hypothetical protein [Mycolicibacterium sp. CBMA 247]MUM46114.1 hypothetical protein [Mycolicibacterium sp. CBMA 294]
MRLLLATWTAVVFTVAAAGCSTASTDRGTPAAPPSPEPSPAPSKFVLLDITIADGTVTPADTELHATAGQPIVVRVHTDEYDDLAIGSDPELRFGIDPRVDGPQVLQFTVDAPGTVSAKLLRQSGCPSRCEYTPERDIAVATIDVGPAPAQPTPEPLDTTGTRVPCELLTPALARQFAGADVQQQPSGDTVCTYTGATRSVSVSVNPLPTNPDAPVNHFSVIRPENQIPGVEYQAYWFAAASSVVVVKDGLLLEFRVSDNPMLPRAQIVQHRKAEDIRLADQIVPRVA